MTRAPRHFHYETFLFDFYSHVDKEEEEKQNHHTHIHRIHLIFYKFFGLTEREMYL